MTRLSHGLDFWLQRFGLGKKSGHGSQVYQMYKNGQWGDIAQYCLDDCKGTWKIAERLGIVKQAGLSDD